MEPGWYSDPDGVGQRWHDGRRWTGVTRPDPATALAQERAEVRRTRTVRRRRRMRPVLIGVVVVAVLGGLAVLARNGDGAIVAEQLGVFRHHRLLAEPTPPSTSSSYRIEKRTATGAPVTYDPCEPIEYAINPVGAPADYLSFIEPAVAEAQATTGLKFEYRGTTSVTFEENLRGTRPKPVVITFPAVLPQSDADEDAVGLGGSTALTVNGQVQPHYLTGAIALRRDWFAQESAAGNNAEERAIVMHELGHVLGLGHVKDRRQMMYPTNVGQLVYADGDLAGLALLGSGTC
ncbi:DUF2510 domain-containing protein [Nocardioides sp.]|uniref:DUF2510 domain-containing protein n=1 Tax=Nocardioides sp. TaxID=35761 RepID=UPI00260258F4|nr:DUF2510 domain-containing protein [Nocardioides sp.]